jgi:hypothetical protein
MGQAWVKIWVNLYRPTVEDGGGARHAAAQVAAAVEHGDRCVALQVCI